MVSTRLDICPGDSGVELSDEKILDYLFIGAVVPDLGVSPIKDQNDSRPVVKILKDWLVDFTKNNHDWALKLSGGLDSRFILFLLKEIGCDNIKAHTFYNPKIGIDNDADVFCSKKAIDSFGINVNHRFEPGFPYEYLRSFDESIEISGIFGTELLGGEMFKHLPVQKAIENNSLSEMLEWVPKSYLERFRYLYYDFIEPLDTKFFINVFTRSTLSQIYDSSASTGWSHPEILYKEFKSPFTGLQLALRISCLDSSRLMNYHFYDEVIGPYKEELLKAPILSGYGEYYATISPPSKVLYSKKITPNFQHSQENLLPNSQESLLPPSSFSNSKKVRPKSMKVEDIYSPGVKQFAKKFEINDTVEFLKVGLNRLSYYI